MGSDGNIMPLHIYKKIFPKGTKEQLMTTKNESFKLQTYNIITITQMGRCKVKIEKTKSKYVLSLYFQEMDKFARHTRY